MTDNHFVALPSFIVLLSLLCCYDVENSGVLMCRIFFGDCVVQNSLLRCAYCAVKNSLLRCAFCTVKNLLLLCAFCAVNNPLLRCTEFANALN